MATYMHHLATTESLCLVQLPKCLAPTMFQNFLHFSRLVERGQNTNTNPLKKFGWYKSIGLAIELLLIYMYMILSITERSGPVFRPGGGHRLLWSGDRYAFISPFVCVCIFYIMVAICIFTCFIACVSRVLLTLYKQSMYPHLPEPFRGAQQLLTTKMNK